jgi:hypothetical protein
MPLAVAIIASITLLALAAYQVVLLRGAPLARFSWGGEDHYLQPRFRRPATLAVVVYLLGVLVILQGADVFQWMPVLACEVLCYLYAAGFFASFIVTARSRSSIERHIGLPVNILLAGMFLIVGVTGHLKG